MNKPGGRIGDYLMERDLLTGDQVDRALAYQREHPQERFVDVVIALGFLTFVEVRSHFPKLLFLERINDHELSHFADSLVHETHPQGHLVFHEGEIGRRAFVVLEGKVRVFHAGERSFTLAVFGPGELFGEMALLDAGHRSASAEVVEACELMVLSREDFLAQLKNKPPIALDVFALLARRLRSADRMLASLLSPHLGDRVIESVVVRRNQWQEATDFRLDLSTLVSELEIPREVVRLILNANLHEMGAAWDGNVLTFPPRTSTTAPLSPPLTGPLSRKNR